MVVVRGLQFTFVTWIYTYTYVFQTIRKIRKMSLTSTKNSKITVGDCKNHIAFYKPGGTNKILAVKPEQFISNSYKIGILKTTEKVLTECSGERDFKDCLKSNYTSYKKALSNAITTCLSGRRVAFYSNKIKQRPAFSWYKFWMPNYFQTYCLQRQYKKNESIITANKKILSQQIDVQCSKEFEQAWHTKMNELFPKRAKILETYSKYTKESQEKIQKQKEIHSKKNKSSLWKILGSLFRTAPLQKINSEKR